MSPWNPFAELELFTQHLPAVFLTEARVIHLLAKRSARPDWESWCKELNSAYFLEKFNETFGWQSKTLDDLPAEPKGQFETVCRRIFGRLQATFLCGLCLSIAGLVSMAGFSLALAFAPDAMTASWLPFFPQSLLLQPILVLVAAIVFTALHLVLLRDFIVRIARAYSIQRWVGIRETELSGVDG